MKYKFIPLANKTKYVLIDGYGKIEGLDGPIRVNDKIMFYDPQQGIFIDAKTKYLLHNNED